MDKPVIVPPTVTGEPGMSGQGRTTQIRERLTWQEKAEVIGALESELANRKRRIHTLGVAIAVLRGDPQEPTDDR